MDKTWYDPTLDMIFQRNDFMHEFHGNLAGILWGHPKEATFLAIGARWHSMVTDRSDFRRDMAVAWPFGNPASGLNATLRF